MAFEPECLNCRHNFDRIRPVANILIISFFIHNMNSIFRLCKLVLNIFPQICMIGSTFLNDLNKRIGS